MFLAIGPWQILLFVIGIPLLVLALVYFLGYRSGKRSK